MSILATLDIKKGIEPDIEVKLTDYKKDNQLSQAKSILAQMIVENNN